VINFFSSRFFNFKPFLTKKILCSHNQDANFVDNFIPLSSRNKFLKKRTPHIILFSHMNPFVMPPLPSCLLLILLILFLQGNSQRIQSPLSFQGIQISTSPCYTYLVPETQTLFACGSPGSFDATAMKSISLKFRFYQLS